MSRWSLIPFPRPAVSADMIFVIVGVPFIIVAFALGVNVSMLSLLSQF